MLDVRRLRVLLAISEHGGIAAAARALSFTPPAVSQQIAALERQLDVGLLDRSQRTARLTAAGQRLARHARTVLADLEAAEADLVSLDGEVRGLLRIATIPTMGHGLLPGVIAALAASASGLDVRIEQLEPEDSLPALARGEFDVALAGEYGLAPRRLDVSIDRVDLFTEPVFIAVPADHRLTGSRVALEELRDDRWIAPAAGSSCAVLLERSCALAGYEPHVVAHCADFDMATALVGAGYGVAILPRIAVRQASPVAVRLLVPVDPQIHRTLFAAVRRGAREHPAISCLLDALRAAAPNDQAGIDQSATDQPVS